MKDETFSVYIFSCHFFRHISNGKKYICAIQIEINFNFMKIILILMPSLDLRLVKGINLNDFGIELNLFWFIVLFSFYFVHTLNAN